MQTTRNADKGAFLRFLSTVNVFGKWRRPKAEAPAIHPSVLDGMFG